MKYLELILRCLTALLRVIFPQHPPVPETTDATGAAPSPASPPLPPHAGDGGDASGDRRLADALPPRRHPSSPPPPGLGAYDQTATDFFRIFNDELRPLGIAAFVVDMPGLGNSANLILDENYSEIAENAILHLKEKVKFIDSTKIGLFGLHLSAAAAVRLAVLRTDLVNGLVVLDPTVHNIFTNVNYLSGAPLCLRSSIANRLNADASNWDTLMPQLQILSLKQQGLLSSSGKCPVNCCVAVSSSDKPLVEDAHAVADAFKNNEFVDFKEISSDLSFSRASALVGKFFKEQFT